MIYMIASPVVVAAVMVIWAKVGSNSCIYVVGCIQQVFFAALTRVLRIV